MKQGANESPTSPGANIINELISQLLNEDKRAQAIELLAHIGEPAVKPLIQAIFDVDKWYWAVETLAIIGEPALPSLIESLADPFLDAFVIHAVTAIGEPAVPLLIGALKNQDAGIRSWSAYALSITGYKQAIQPLLEALRDLDPLVRRNVVEALGKTNDPSILGKLAWIAENDEDTEVRNTAAWLLNPPSIEEA